MIFVFFSSIFRLTILPDLLELIKKNLIEKLVKKCLKDGISYVYTKTNNNDLKNYYLKKHEAKIIYKNSFWNMKYYVI